MIYIASMDSIIILLIFFPVLACGLLKSYVYKFYFAVVDVCWALVQDQRLRWPALRIFKSAEEND